MNQFCNCPQVFFSVLMGAMQLGQAAPYVEAYSVARSAAATVFNVIDRVPEMDSSSQEGEKPSKLEGNIKFRDVSFNYPSRPDVEVSLCGAQLEGTARPNSTKTIATGKWYFDPLLMGQYNIVFCYAAEWNTLHGIWYPT